MKLLTLLGFTRIGRSRRWVMIGLGLVALISPGQAIEPPSLGLEAAGSNQPFAARQGLTLTAVSPDGQHLASVNQAGQAELRDLGDGRLLGILPGREGVRLTGLAFGPRGGVLAASADDGLVDLWDLAAADTPRRSLAGHDGARIDQLLYSPDGTLLATTATDGRIKIWDTAAGTARYILPGHEGAAILALAFSADGLTLASSADNSQAKFWNLTSGLEGKAIAGLGTTFNDIDFSGDGRWFAALGQDGGIRLWDVASGTERIPAVQNPDNARSLAVAFSPDGASLAGIGADSQVRLWDAATGQLRHTLPAPAGARLSAVSFDPTGATLAAASEGQPPALWNAASGTPLPTPATAAGDTVGTLAYGPDGKTLVGENRAGQITVWALPSGNPRFTVSGAVPAGATYSADSTTASAPVALAAPATAVASAAAVATPAPTAPAAPAAPTRTAPAAKPVASGPPLPAAHNWKGVTALAISPDGTLIGAAGLAGDLRIGLIDGTPKFTLKAHHGLPVTAVRFTKDGKSLLSVGRDSEAEQWDVATGAPGRSYRGPEHAVRALDIAPDGSLAVAGEDLRIMSWDGTGKLSQIFSGHHGFVNAIAFSPDGTLIASGGADTRLRIWDRRTGQATKSLPCAAEINAVAFSPDGKTVAVGGTDSLVRLWDVATGLQVQKLAGHNAPVRSVAFNANGTRLATGGEDARVLVWNMANGKLQKAISAPAIVNTVAFDKGNKLYTGDEANNLGKWDPETGNNLGTVPVPPPSTSNTHTDPAPAGAAPLAVAAARSETVLSTALGRVLDWLVPPVEAAIPTPPGGPILVVTSAANKFSAYYTEILRNEGFNEYATADIGGVSSTTLAGYDVVILGEMALSASQATMFGDWVTAGGNLIVMRPDASNANLASLLGLSSAGGTLAEAYLRVDPLQGNGVVNQTMQFHGTADRYTAGGATVVATLYSDWTTATANPAVTVRSVGSNGGQAAAFTYDLARSIVYTRQGNPAWVGQERDGFTPKRSDDMFYGAAAGDPKPDWVDLLNKVAIPQADEQQRLLANLILKMNLDKKPLPRFWYFPNGKKAVVIMTGDDHGNGGTSGRFDWFQQQSPAGCDVANWECIRGTSYMFTGSISAAAAKSYADAGFEVGLHVNTNCADWTPASLESFYVQQLGDFTATYTSIPAPITQRHHCIAWSDWASAAKVQLNHGIRLDTSYYYWPPGWVDDRPGFFTGSAMPMRSADTDGTLIDNYNVVSHMTDESGQTYPFTIDTLLNRALGSEGYYGAYTINAHTDLSLTNEAQTTVTSAKARNVPVVSSAQMLTWLDGRNTSSFGNLAWTGGNTLSFTVTQGTGANGLRAMLPRYSATGALTGISGPGGAVAYTLDTIKGVEYAFFPVAAGGYTATYTADTTPPAVTATSPANGATGVSQQPTVTATFSETIDPSTLNAADFQLQAGTHPPVAVTLGYDAGTRTATLAPNAALASSTAYTATLTGIKDLFGNVLAGPVTWSFTTEAQPCAGAPCTLWAATATPGNPSVNDPNPVELGVKFKSDIAGQITGIRFYKGSGNTGTHVGTLWSSSGQQLAQATFGNETATGWQQVDFAQPVTITANTTYVASYHAPNGNYAGDNNYFSSSGVDNAPLHAPSSVNAGGNGVYAYGSGSLFPSSSYQASNYWVDVVFSTAGAGPDTTPPAVTAQTPAPGATGVTTNASVTATFGEAVDPATVTGSTFTLKDPAGNPVAGAVSYDTAGHVATLKPAAALAVSTAYTATLTGGANGIKDLAGNALAANASWTFTTGTSTGPDCAGATSLWPANPTPATPADADTASIEVGVKFRATVDGYICGLRFYKASTNTGSHTGTLWSGTGTALATATFTNETASGWQQVLFASPVAVTANTVYTASYHAPVGHYSVNENYFTAGVTSGPLYAPSSTEAGGNGVYLYGSGGLPANTYLSSNYWVDVLFVAGGSPPAASANTGFLSPAANAPVTTSAGDNNGFETTPANAYAADGLFAVDAGSGTNTNTSCTNTGKDKHAFYNYGFNVPTGVAINGIEVRLTAKADGTTGAPRMCVQLSWNGGTTWTPAQTSPNLSTTNATYALGGAANNWGRTAWAAGDFSNANFRVRVIDVASATRTFSLDSVVAQVTYQ